MIDGDDLYLRLDRWHIMLIRLCVGGALTLGAVTVGLWHWWTGHPGEGLAYAFALFVPAIIITPMVEDVGECIRWIHQKIDDKT